MGGRGSSERLGCRGSGGREGVWWEGRGSEIKLLLFHVVSNF